MNILLQIFFMAFSMFWEVLWPLILGFTLSAIVQAVVSHASLSKTLGGDSPKNLTLATLFGIASSSCSYAAVALARSLFQKGASFTSAMVFQLASTNLVIELGIILVVILGWQFALAEFAGGILMIILLALLFRLTLTPHIVAMAKKQAAKGLVGKMEGHAHMDMSVYQGKHHTPGVLASPNQRNVKVKIQKIFTAVSHYFVMDILSVWIDIALGFLIAGALTVVVPHALWQSFFLTNNSNWSYIEGPLIGSLVAIISFVCSVGNIPLAAVLWQGGISFGGVISFIFADLLVLPILDIYRKYYGIKVTGYIFLTYFITMAVAGYGIELLFTFLKIIPTDRHVTFITEGIHWNYTSWLNIAFLFIAITLAIRFLTTKGVEMIRMMNASQHKHHMH